MSSWSSPVERRYSKTPLFLSYTKSIITGNEKRTADSERRATDRTGKLLEKSIEAGVTELEGIIDIMFDRIIP
jgi:hypothetical protein